MKITTKVHKDNLAMYKGPKLLPGDKIISEKLLGNNIYTIKFNLV